MNAHSDFQVGDRVRVSGGYDTNPGWLAGGQGYTGQVIDIHEKYAVVELDEPLRLIAPRGGWSGFGDGDSEARAQVEVACGDWLVLGLAYEGAVWSAEVMRLHVSVCSEHPDLQAIPPGGGIGVWVESHATISHL